MTVFYGEELALIHAEAFEALADAAAETFLPLLGTGERSLRILDLGCGAGPLCTRLEAAGFSTWGLDISPAFIAQARRRTPDTEFVCASILDARLPPAAGAVAIGEVLNYATMGDGAALAEVLDRIFHALEPGGLFLFDVAAPGRVGSGRSFTESEDWAVGMIATEQDSVLTRRIHTFRRKSDCVWTGSREEHRLRLWRPAEVMARLTYCGFEAKELPGYAGAAMPSALHVYLARKPA